MSTRKSTLTRNSSFAKGNDYFAVDLVRLREALAARSPAVAEWLDTTLRNGCVDTGEFFELLLLAGIKVAE
jgi:hypothetical protein